MVVEGFHEDRGVLLRAQRQTSGFLPSPGRAAPVGPVERNGYGSCASAVRGRGRVQAGREGVRAHRRRRPAATTQKVTTWASVTNQVLALREHLIAEQVTLVVREATGDYWKPFYYLLEDGPFEVLLVNARHVKNMPGRKADVSDSMWLAQLGAHGLVRGSFVPPQPIRQLRDLNRTRTAVVRERPREYQRLEKLLEDALLTELRGGFAVSCG